MGMLAVVGSTLVALGIAGIVERDPRPQASTACSHRKKPGNSIQSLPISAKEQGANAGSPPLPDTPPRPGVLNDAEAVFKRIAKEARHEYEKLKSGVVQGDFEALVPNLLDNGRVVDQAEAKRLWAEFSRGLQHEQQVFESLADVKTVPSDYKVDRAVSYQFPSLDKEGHAVGATKTEGITVSFRLDGSSEVGTVLFRRLRGSATVAEDGTLIVVMKKIEGKWYWNPFGW